MTRRTVITENACDRCGADVENGQGHYPCDNGERLCSECAEVHECDACTGARLDALATGDPCPWNCDTRLVTTTIRKAVRGRSGWRDIYFEVAQCPGCGWYWTGD